MPSNHEPRRTLNPKAPKTSEASSSDRPLIWPSPSHRRDDTLRKAHRPSGARATTEHRVGGCPPAGPAAVGFTNSEELTNPPTLEPTSIEPGHPLERDPETVELTNPERSTSSRAPERPPSVRTGGLPLSDRPCAFGFANPEGFTNPRAPKQSSRPIVLRIASPERLLILRTPNPRDSSPATCSVLSTHQRPTPKSESHQRKVSARVTVASSFACSHQPSNNKLRRACRFPASRNPQSRRRAVRPRVPGAICNVWLGSLGHSEERLRQPRHRLLKLLSRRSIKPRKVVYRAGPASQFHEFGAFERNPRKNSVRRRRARRRAQLGWTSIHLSQTWIRRPLPERNEHRRQP